MVWKTTMVDLDKRMGGECAKSIYLALFRHHTTSDFSSEYSSVYDDDDDDDKISVHSTSPYLLTQYLLEPTGKAAAAAPPLYDY
jgi:hypothetical protein